MTKRKVTKLFAVVALATGTPAMAGPDDDRVPARGAAPSAIARSQPDPWLGVREARPPVQPAPVTRAVLALFGISTPRRLPNGAPACGNVASRAPRSADCARTRRDPR